MMRGGGRGAVWVPVLDVGRRMVASGRRFS